MYFATPTELDILNGKNHIFLFCFMALKIAQLKSLQLIKDAKLVHEPRESGFCSNKMSVTQAKFKNKKSSKEISSRILGSS